MNKQDRWPLGARVRVSLFGDRQVSNGSTGVINRYCNRAGRTRLRLKMDKPSQGYPEFDCENVIIISPECPNCGEYVLDDQDYVCNMCRWEIDKVYEVQILHSSVESV